MSRIDTKPFSLALLATLVALPIFAPPLFAGRPSEPAAAVAAPAARGPEGPWRGQDGKLLPFADADAALDFLRSAEIVERHVIQGTFNNPVRLTLERDGVRARAIFRTVEQSGMSLNQKIDHRLMLRDSYRFEVAAWELARLLGLDNVPPTALRTIDGQEGSIQLWIEQASPVDALTAGGQALAQPDLYALQRHELQVFDALILNYDRNAGNQLLDGGGKLWYVDHTRTFMRMPDLLDADNLRFCDRRLLNGLKQLDRDAVKTALAPYLEPAQIDALLKRQKLLLKRFDRLIAERGEDAVVFELIRPRAAA